MEPLIPTFSPSEGEKEKTLLPDNIHQTVITQNRGNLLPLPFGERERAGEGFQLHVTAQWSERRRTIDGDRSVPGSEKAYTGKAERKGQRLLRLSFFRCPRSNLLLCGALPNLGNSIQS